jgi:peptidoglycan-associated lipoprotein
MNMSKSRTYQIVCVALLAATVACAPRKPKVTNTTPPPATDTTTAPRTTTATTPPPVTPPPQRLEEPAPVRLSEDSTTSRSIEDLNRDSLLKPAFFPVDSFDLDDSGRAVVSANAELLKKYPTWKITVEGHADERGTPEYNLALGDKRASAVKTYLVSLGVPADRLQTISYGKEFPFEPGHDENAWSKNRRAHFVITAK